MLWMQFGRCRITGYAVPAIALCGVILRTFNTAYSLELARQRFSAFSHHPKFPIFSYHLKFFIFLHRLSSTNRFFILLKFEQNSV